MTIGELLERGYVKKVCVYTATEIEDYFVNVYKGTREQIPETIRNLSIHCWGIEKGCVDISVPLKAEDDIQAFLDSLALEEKKLLHQIETSNTQENKDFCESERKIIRKILRNFAKNMRSTPPTNS